MLQEAEPIDPRALARSIWSAEDLPDVRLFDRLVDGVAMLARRLEAAATEELRKARRGFQRFFRNARVDPKALKSKADDFAVAEIQSEEVILVAHDTTEVDLHGPYEPSDAGVLRSSQARGYLVHSALAIHPVTGRTLALLDSHAWTRRGPMRHGDHKGRRPQDRESAKWRRGIRRVTAMVGKAGLKVRMVHVFDAEGAIHENFAFARKEHHAVLARVSEERCIAEGPGKLWAHLAAQPVVQSWETQVRTAASRDALKAARHQAEKEAAREAMCAGDLARQEGLGRRMAPSDASKRARMARLAVLRRVGDAAVARIQETVQRLGSTRAVTLEVRHAPVTLTPKDGRKPVKVNAVYFREIDAPTNVEPVEWMVLTTCVVQDAHDALQIGRWYQMRYAIEEIHKVFKTGLHMEDEPFDEIRSFQRFLAVAGPVATQIMRWREHARTDPQAPASEHVDAAMLDMLKEACRYHGFVLPRRPWTLKDFIVRLAQLGGYERRPDRQPGWLVIWRGMRRLQEFAGIYAYVQSSKKTATGPRCVPK